MELHGHIHSFSYNAISIQITRWQWIILQLVMPSPLLSCWNTIGWPFVDNSCQLLLYLNIIGWSLFMSKLPRGKLYNTYSRNLRENPCILKVYIVRRCGLSFKNLPHSSQSMYISLLSCIGRDFRDKFLEEFSWKMSFRMRMGNMYMRVDLLCILLRAFCDWMSDMSQVQYLRFLSKKMRAKKMYLTIFDGSGEPRGGAVLRSDPRVPVDP